MDNLMMCTVRALVKESKDKIVDVLEQGRVNYILHSYIEGNVLMFNIDFMFSNVGIKQHDNLTIISICDNNNYTVCQIKLYDSEYLSINLHI